MISIYLLTYHNGMPCYVGRTKNPSTRWSQHKEGGYFDIKLDGMAILQQCHTPSEASCAEKKWIQFFREFTNNSLWNFKKGFGVATPDMAYAVRLPQDASDCVKRDAKTQRLSVSNVLRKIIFKYYGLLNGG